ncbi:hypothetical protein F4861DRAFT_131988 [Xylaria intraflava]|nr:hypothetical protein F4861DRAFT_131988 [Xylaria intraflava]
MEALAAVALAGNVAQFLEYAIILVSKTPEILRSPDRTLKEVSELESIVDDVEQSLHNISPSNLKYQNGAKPDKTLNELTRKCLTISNEIMTIVDSLKLKTPEAGVMQGAAIVTKSLFKMPKLKQLSESLYDLRDQVSAHLITLIRQQQHELSLTLQNFTTSSEEFRANTEADLQMVINYLQRITEQIKVRQNLDRRKSPKSGKANKTRAQQTAKPMESPKLHLVRPYLDDYIYSVESLVEQKQKSILQSLYFSQLKDREFAVADAHKSTLEWIFKQSSTNFVEWLHEDNGIYWISGRAGSGKSTLMKFLTNHPSTIRHLEEWAGQEPLIIAKHYFWSSGTLTQKSQEGLFRSLLLQILSQRTALIQTACADRWNARYTDSFNPWSRAELARTLENIAMDQADYKICLFIDGLDEYNGDHAQLVNVIRRISDLKNMKICASSRPWLDFSDAFENSPWKLHLQDLTVGDIRQFVQDNLQADARFNKLQQRDTFAADELTSEITKRANGVFLWVFLVVRSILRGLGNEDTILDLQRRLRELPSDLHQFFDRMLMTIEEVYIRRVARLFLTMSHAQTTFPVITFYFMDFGDEPFSSKPLPFLRAWPDVDPIEAEALSTKKRQLIARCRDLICIVPDPDAPVLFAERVGFLHRTVTDFLHTASIEEKLLQIAGADFNHTKILLGANLGQVRSLMHLHRLTYIMPYLRQWILGTLYYAHEIEVLSGNAEVDALDELDSIITREFARWGFAHAVKCIFDLPGIASFLELACKCDLALYVGHKYPQCTVQDLDTLAPGWRQLLEIQRDSNFEIRARHTMDDVENCWRVGRALGLVHSFEKNDPLDVRAHDVPLAERQVPVYPKRRAWSKLSRVFERWRS